MGETGRSDSRSIPRNAQSCQMWQCSKNWGEKVNCSELALAVLFVVCFDEPCFYLILVSERALERDDILYIEGVQN